MVTKIFNLIILDESGSMNCVQGQTISGCNETINTIKVAQEKYADTQEHFVSIFAFQGNGNKPSRYLIKNAPAQEAKHITKEDYTPNGMTPLYDAVGGTLADLKAVCRGEEIAIGSVTIITDGAENDSSHYTLSQVAKMIEELKKMGWNFNFIGANIDVRGTAESLNIDNALAFEQNEAGTQAMFERERRSRIRYYGRTSMAISDAGENEAPLCARLEEASKDYFDETEDDNKEK